MAPVSKLAKYRFPVTLGLLILIGGIGVNNFKYLFGEQIRERSQKVFPPTSEQELEALKARKKATKD